MPSQPVPYMRWLDRFEVRIAYDRYSDFTDAIARRLYTQLVSRTESMTMDDLIAHFDPDADGRVTAAEMQAALAALDLGLSPTQLQRLVYDLGIDGPLAHRASPIEVLCVLLDAIRPAARRTRRDSAAFHPSCESLRSFTNDGSRKNAFSYALSVTDSHQAQIVVQQRHGAPVGLAPQHALRRVRVGRQKAQHALSTANLAVAHLLEAAERLSVRDRREFAALRQEDGTRRLGKGKLGRRAARPAGRRRRPPAAPPAARRSTRRSAPTRPRRARRAGRAPTCRSTPP